VAVAQIIRRKGAVQFRVGFGEDSRRLDPIDDVADDLLGAFVEIEEDADATRARIRTNDGAPVILAGADTALAALYLLAVRNGLRVDFPAPVWQEADAWIASPGIDDDALVDLTKLPFITIDYERSFDLDQAMYIEVVSGGHCLYYALADAAYYVRPGSALFDEAVHRASSYYLPGLTVPMLPSCLSEGIVSLNEGVDRRALVLRIVVDTAGAATSTELIRARVRSRAKLTYDGVQAFIDDPAASELAGKDYTETLQLLRTIGEVRIARAEERDVVKFDRVAAGLRLAGDDASELSISAEARNDVQLWNEQVSLLCNIEGARFLRERVDATTGFAGVFRVHPPPTAEEMDRLCGAIERLVNTLELDESWLWRRPESLADYVARLPTDGEGARLSQALQRQAMLINVPSYFATEPAPGHYGIGAAAYSRFSSPMREMVGVVTSHMAFHQLASTPISDSGLDRDHVEKIVNGGNHAKKLQKRITRHANKLALDHLFARDVAADAKERPVRVGTVMGVSASKLYVQLDDPPVEVKLYTADLTVSLGGKLDIPSRFELIAADGRCIRVGDALNVSVDRYDEDRQRWILSPV